MLLVRRCGKVDRKPPAVNEVMLGGFPRVKRCAVVAGEMMRMVGIGVGGVGCNVSRENSGYSGVFRFFA